MRQWTIWQRTAGVITVVWACGACATGPRAKPIATIPTAPTVHGARLAAGPRPVAAGPSSLEEYIRAVRKLSENARPAAAVDRASPLESADPALAAAIRQLRLAPTARHQDLVAALYRRAGVLDAAYDHYTDALRVDPRDAAAFDGRARIWRDWGFPGFALGDAYRAVYFAPGSSAARNTLGTVLQGLGHLAAARQQYRKALALQPDAAYALNNLCYAAILGGQASAIATCRRAVAASDGSVTTRHNLALAYAAAGQLKAARRVFAAADPIDAPYNMGIACLATGHYAEAAVAFNAAYKAQPQLRAAQVLADRARRLAAAQETAHANRH